MLIVLVNHFEKHSSAVMTVTRQRLNIYFLYTITSWPQSRAVRKRKNSWHGFYTEMSLSAMRRMAMILSTDMILSMSMRRSMRTQEFLSNYESLYEHERLQVCQSHREHHRACQYHRRHNSGSKCHRGHHTACQCHRG